MEVETADMGEAQEAPAESSTKSQSTRSTRGRVTLPEDAAGSKETEEEGSVGRQLKSLKRASQISEFLREQALSIDLVDVTEKRQQRVAEKLKEQEEEEAKGRREHAHAKALFRSLETLAQAATDCFFQAGPEEAAYLLQAAIMEAEEEEEPVEAPAPAVAIARAGARVLFCTALSKAGAHSDALEVARDAAEMIDGVLPALSIDEEEEFDGQESAHSSEASLDGEEVEDPYVDARRARKLQLLERAVELAVQARQCQCLELEFSAQAAAEEALFGPAQPSEGADAFSPAEIAAGLRAEVAELHKEGPELARKHLPKANYVRIAAEKAFHAWQVRSMRITDGSIPPLHPKDMRAALAATRPRTYKTRPAEDGLSLTKHERLYQGVPPLIDLREERLRRRGQSLSSTSPASTMFPSSDALDDFTKTKSDITRTLSVPSMPSVGPRPTLAISNLSMPQPAAASLSQSAATLNFELGMQESWGKNSVKLGDLYTRSQMRKSDMPKGSNNWQSVRRSPVSFGIHGPAGKASWALRQEKRRKVNEDGHKINAFEDWKKNATGPRVNVKDQVLQTEGGVKHFKADMKNESRKFKNFWLKEEVTADDLWEDRTFYGTEGIRILRKAQPPKQPAGHTEKASQLFYYYNVPGPANSEHVGLTHAELAGYGKLLDKSGSYLKKHMPHKRSNRYDLQALPAAQMQFSDLKGLFKL